MAFLYAPERQYLQLPVDIPDSPYAANGPQNLANTVIDAAVQSKAAPDLLERLHAGNIAVGVLFAPHNMTSLSSDFDNIAIYGGVKADGASLTVSHAIISEQGAQATVNFRRAAPGKPYVAKTHDDNGERILLSEGVALPDRVIHSLAWIATGSGRINARLKTDAESRRLTPYVNITKL